MEPIEVFITISDPWDVGEAVNWRRIKGQVLQMEDNHMGGQAIIGLEMPINYRNVVYSYVVASPRFEGHAIMEFISGKKVCAGFIGISDEQAKSITPMDVRHWRGGLAFIGDLEK